MLWPTQGSTVVSLCLCFLVIDASDWRLSSDFEVEVHPEDTIGGGWAPQGVPRGEELVARKNQKGGLAGWTGVLWPVVVGSIN